MQLGIWKSMLTQHSGSVLILTNVSVGFEVTMTAVARRNQFQNCMLADVLRVLWLRKMKK
jgi:hypothetical protein